VYNIKYVIRFNKLRRTGKRTLKGKSYLDSIKIVKMTAITYLCRNGTW